MLEECIASQCEVIRAIMSDHSPCTAHGTIVLWSCKPRLEVRPAARQATAEPATPGFGHGWVMGLGRLTTKAFFRILGSESRAPPSLAPVAVRFVPISRTCRAKAGAFQKSRSVQQQPSKTQAVTGRPRAFIFSLENAVCKDSYR